MIAFVPSSKMSFKREDMYRLLIQKAIEAWKRLQPLFLRWSSGVPLSASVREHSKNSADCHNSPSRGLNPSKRHLAQTHAAAWVKTPSRGTLIRALKHRTKSAWRYILVWMPNRLRPYDHGDLCKRARHCQNLCADLRRWSYCLWGFGISRCGSTQKYGRRPIFHVWTTALPKDARRTAWQKNTKEQIGTWGSSTRKLQF